MRDEHVVLYLELPQALAVTNALGFHVRDAGLLDSALSRPSAGMYGSDAYGDLLTKAAALMSSLAQNHSLFDGNKRLSWILTLTFLEFNGVAIDMPTDVAFALVLEVATGNASLEEIADALARHTRALPH